MTSAVPEPDSLAFLANGGRVGGLMRTHDWFSSPLGDPRSWPRPLSAAVEILLGSKFPMFVAWGPELCFVYNDGYADILGAKHPAALGAPFHDIWREIWPDVEPLIEAAMAGEATYREDLPLTVNRHGHDEQAWFTFSYSPLRDEGGRVAGLFCAVSETTGRVLAERRDAFLLRLHDQLRELDGPEEVKSAAVEALARELGAARAYYVHVDEQAGTVRIGSIWTDGGLPAIGGIVAGSEEIAALLRPLRSGQTLALEETGGGASWAAPGSSVPVRAVLAVPLVKDGQLVAILSVDHPQPRHWSDAEKHLAEAVAERTWSVVERARSEAERRATEGRFRALVEAGAYSVYRMSQDWTQMRRLAGRGFQPDADMNRSDWLQSYIPAEDQGRVAQVVAQAIQSGAAIELEHRIFRANGKVGWALSRAVPIKGPDGNVAEWFGVASDITDRKRSEAALERRSSQMQQLAQAALDVAQAPTLQATLDEITRAARQIIGAHQAVVSLSRGPDWSQAISTVALSDKYARWRGLEAAPDGSGIDAWVCAENRPVRMTQAELEAHPLWRGFGSHAGEHPPMRGWLAAPLIGRDGRNLGLIQLSNKEDGGDFDAADEAMLVQLAQVASAAIEQTDAESRLRASEEQLRLATEAAEVGLWDVDLVSDSLFWPPRVKAMFGVSADRPVTLADFYAGLHPADRDAVSAAFASALDPAVRALYDVEYRTVGKEDGVVRWVAAKGRGVFDERGHCVRVIGTAREITERKLAEARLRELNETLERRVGEALAERKLLAEILEGTDVLVQVADLQYRFMAINDAAAREFARLFRTRRPLAGDSILELLALRPEQLERLRSLWARAFAGEEFVEVHALQGSELEVRHYEMRFRTLRDRDGTILGAYQFVLDVTERLEEQARLQAAEAALQQAQKMEAVGQLTGGIAHDFNNLLQGVAGSLDLIRRKSDDPARVRRWAEGGLQAAERGAKLTGQLLAFSRAQRLEAKPVVVADIVAGMRDLLDRTLGPLVTVTLDLDDAGVPVLSDPTQLELAVLNLSINARDAMPGGGELFIQTRPIKIDREPGLEAGEYVELLVRDTGAGMTPEVAARAFDPFFTTKETGKGTGLGLSQVYGVARQGGGIARLQSSSGTGTTVRVLLRRTEQALEPEPAAEPGVADLRVASATVLVVDDDDDVRRFLVDSLDALGYRVEAAPDGRSGLDALDRITPDLLLIDFAMPDMNGAEVAKAARKRRPRLPIVFASGYSDTAAIENAVGPGAPLLRKPFRVDELQAAVADALAAD